MVNGNMARARGIAGIGIGVTELVAPQWIGKQLGIAPRPGLTRAMGAREVVSGIGILARRNPAAGQWARVFGDLLDTALLGVAATRSRHRKVVLGVLGAVIAIGILDFISARRL